jgi:hypothetical protein
MRISMPEPVTIVTSAVSILATFPVNAYAGTNLVLSEHYRDGSWTYAVGLAEGTFAETFDVCHKWDDLDEARSAFLAECIDRGCVPVWA